MFYNEYNLIQPIAKTDLYFIHLAGAPAQDKLIINWGGASGGLALLITFSWGNASGIAMCLVSYNGAITNIVGTTDTSYGSGYVQIPRNGYLHHIVISFGKKTAYLLA